MEKRKEHDKAKERQQEELSKQKQIEKVTFDPVSPFTCPGAEIRI